MVANIRLLMLVSESPSTNSYLLMEINMTKFSDHNTLLLLFGDRAFTSVRFFLLAFISNLEIKNHKVSSNLFFKILFIFRVRVREGEREGEKHQLVTSRRPPTRDLAYNPGMYPDWELNV